MNKILNQEKIVSLLKQLDNLINYPCSIVICGGAAAIVGYGLKRLTGDIDILEPFPKHSSFYKSVKELLEYNDLDSNAINDGAKGFVSHLSPNYRKRVIPLNAGFKNLDVSIISKADFITMKICAWRESDIQDVKSIGISKEDLLIIDENISHMARFQPDIAQKAQLVLSEIGIRKAPVIKPENVNSLSELIQFFKEKTSNDASLDDIKKWRNDIASGLKPSFLAINISKKNNLFIGMDI